MFNLVRENIKLSEKLRSSTKKLLVKCQKSLFSEKSSVPLEFAL